MRKGQKRKRSYTVTRREGWGKEKRVGALIRHDHRTRGLARPIVLGWPGER